MLLGVHVSAVSHVLDKSKSMPLHDAIQRDLDAHGLNCAQIFTHGPRNTKMNKLDVDAIVDVCTDIDLSVHSSYSSVGIWNVNADNVNSAKSKASIKHIADQLNACKLIGAWGLVLHISKKYAEDIAYGMKLIKPYAKKTGVKIILEMVASKADANLTYETPAKIDNLTTLIGKDADWWCWCVDTAHIWGAGIDITSYESMRDWLNALTFKNKIQMFHLNGSSAVRGSGKDKHEVAFSPDDLIWKDIKPENSGLRAVVEFATQKKCTVICEIKRGLQADITKAIHHIIDISETMH